MHAAIGIYAVALLVFLPWFLASYTKVNTFFLDVSTNVTVHESQMTELPDWPCATSFAGNRQLQQSSETSPVVLREQKSKL